MLPRGRAGRSAQLAQGFGNVNVLLGSTQLLPPCAARVAGPLTSKADVGAVAQSDTRLDFELKASCDGSHTSGSAVRLSAREMLLLMVSPDIWFICVGMFNSSGT